MMKFSPFLAAAAIAASLALPAIAQTGSMGNMAMPSASPRGNMDMSKVKGLVKVSLASQNNSGETGTAFLIPEGAQTKVILSLKGAPADAQPVHIHKGPCTKLNPKPAYPLTTLLDGKSTTVVNAPIATLTDGSYSINAHKSTSDIGTYVSCGDIPKVAASAM